MNTPDVESDYDHAASISEWEEFPVVTLDQGQLRLEMSSQELGHVLLADSNRFDRISAKSRTQDPYEFVVKQLESSGDKHSLNVNTYLTRYEFSPSRRQRGA